MRSRGRSIRLRIYSLVAIPLVIMVGLLAYVGATLADDAISLGRAANLIHATSVPAGFVNDLQAERVAAVVYLFRPTPATLRAYQAAITATSAHEPALKTALTSRATVSSETAAEAAAIRTTLAGLAKLDQLRFAVLHRLLTPLHALRAYNQAIAAEPKLLLVEAQSVTDAETADQALALFAAVSAAEALSQEDALLSGVLAGHRITQADRAAFAEMAANRQAGTEDYRSLFTPANLATYDAALTGTSALQQELNGIQGRVLAGVAPRKLRVTLPQWQAVAGPLLQAHFTAGINTANAQLAGTRRISRAAWVRGAVIGSVALAGLLLTITATALVGRGIVRRLRGLETAALTLAEQQLPDVLARVRRGEGVDVATEAPPPRLGNDEIGRVGRAFDLVRQTAIGAAVEEARLRGGLNGVFRSLARRSQSLLHRQLALLDQMERRASDPEALDDLFRLDHLTTRMRRYAEGLVIVSGAPPGRGWNSPVRMVDVMRGAVAEVEDYARVSVVTGSQAALAGPAVADVIHLLAELVENATALSPPYTSVRVSGEMVASGFAIEVEDRGLGMSPERLAELNERLANPPEFNPADGEQLGLVVAGRLARRHGIEVTLRPSPYGGVSAVVLIPPQLVVTEEASRAGLPGEPAAMAMAEAAGGGDVEGLPRRIDQTSLDPQLRAGLPYRRSRGTAAADPGRDTDPAAGSAPRGEPDRPDIGAGWRIGEVG